MSIPPDINDSLIDSANKAANGSDIIHRVGNDPEGSFIETLSGPTPSIKEWYAQQAVRIDEDVAQSIESVTARAEAAEAAAVVAQTAADVAQLSAGVYASTALGLAATAVDRYFSVPSADSAEYLILYENVAGVATERKRYPSKSAVDSVKNYTDSFYVAPPKVVTTYTLGSYVNKLTGALVAGAGYACSDYVPVAPGDTVLLKSGRIGSLAAFYNASHQYISGMEGSGPTRETKPIEFIAPLGAAYVRYSVNLAITPLADFYAYVYSLYGPNDVRVKALALGKPDVAGYHDGSNVNLFDISKMSTTTFIDHVTGAIVSNSSFPYYGRTDYVAVAPNTSYFTSFNDVASWIAEYDESKVFIRGHVGRATKFFITSPFTKYVIATLRHADAAVYYFTLEQHATYAPNQDTAKETLVWLEPRLREVQERAAAAEVIKTRIDGFAEGASVNLFDISKLVTASFVDHATGAFVSNASFPTVGRTGFIAVEPDTSYVTSFNDVSSWVAEYDVNKVFVRGHAGRVTNVFITSPTTRFVVANLKHADAAIYSLIPSDYAGDPAVWDTNKQTLRWLEPRLREIQERATSAVLPDISARRFVDKKLLVSGDSITEFNFRATKNWHAYLDDWFLLNQVQNDGKSGTGLIKTGDASVAGMCYRLASWQANYQTPDFILLMGNMNDGTSGATGAWDWIYGAGDAHKGDFTTAVTTGNMANSLWYALRYLFETLITMYPTKPMGFIISQPRRQTAVKSGTARPGYTTNCWGDSGWFSEWCDVIERVAGHYSIPTLNLYRGSGLRPWNATNDAMYFSSASSPTGDGIHPNALGQETIAQKGYEFVKQYL